MLSANHQNGMDDLILANGVRPPLIGRSVQVPTTRKHFAFRRELPLGSDILQLVFLTCFTFSTEETLPTLVGGPCWWFLCLVWGWFWVFVGCFAAGGFGLFPFPPSICSVSFPSTMTWAHRPHGVRTRGKKERGKVASVTSHLNHLRWRGNPGSPCAGFGSAKRCACATNLVWSRRYPLSKLFAVFTGSMPKKNSLLSQSDIPDLQGGTPVSVIAQTCGRASCLKFAQLSKASTNVHHTGKSTNMRVEKACKLGLEDDAVNFLPSVADIEVFGSEVDLIRPDTRMPLRDPIQSQSGLCPG